MITVKSDFEVRVVEVESYFRLLEDVIEKDAVLYFPSKRTHKIKNIDLELLKVLKANCFLLLYNLVESSVKMTISEIYDDISKQCVKYDQVSDNVKKVWIKEYYKNFKNKGETFITESFESLSNDIIDIEFDSDKTISGNIDGRKIRKFAEIYGFQMRIHYTAGDGSKLHIVKNRRNSLAHGSISFSECGREFTYDDLLGVKNQVVRYMRQVLNSVERFLNNKEYLM